MAPAVRSSVSASPSCSATTHLLTSSRIWLSVNKITSYDEHYLLSHLQLAFSIILINIIKTKQVSNSLEWYLPKSFDIINLIKNMIHAHKKLLIFAFWFDWKVNSPETAKKSWIVVISSTASVKIRTSLSQASLNTSMFSWATLDLGRLAKIRAALMTYKFN